MRKSRTIDELWGLSDEKNKVYPKKSDVFDHMANPVRRKIEYSPGYSSIYTTPYWKTYREMLPVVMESGYEHFTWGQSVYALDIVDDKPRMGKYICEITELRSN